MSIVAKVVPWAGVQRARAEYNSPRRHAGIRGAGDGRTYVAEEVAREFVDAHDLVLVAVPAGEGEAAAAAIEQLAEPVSLTRARL